MFCRFCGAQIDEDSKFCDRCGKVQNGNNSIESGKSKGSISIKKTTLIYGIAAIVVLVIVVLLVSRLVNPSNKSEKLARDDSDKTEDYESYDDEKTVIDETDYDKGEIGQKDTDSSPTEKEDNQPKHFEMDERLKNAKLSDGYVQIADMVFQSGCNMTLEEVRDVVESSSLNLTCKEYFSKEGEVLFDAEDKYGKVLSLGWFICRGDSAYGDVGKIYLSSVDIYDMRGGQDYDSVYYGPFSYKTRSRGGQGLFNGQPLTRDILYDYMNAESIPPAKDLDDMFGYYPMCYEENGLESTDIVVCDYSRVDKYDNHNWVAKYTYSFRWNTDGTLESVFFWCNEICDVHDEHLHYN